MTARHGPVRLVAINPDGFSLGLAYLEASLRTRFGDGLRVEQSISDLYQVHRREIDLASLAADLVADDPVLVGLSWYTWNHRLMQDLAQLVHSLAPTCQIVVGGPEAGTIEGRELAVFPAGTLFVIGEGEGTLTAIIGDLLNTGGIGRELPAGTVQLTSDGLVRAARRQAALPASQIASPVLADTLREATTDWLPSYATTRGCVFKCSFCAWQDGFREREFDLDQVFLELDVLAARKYDRIWITDTIFGRNEPRTLQIIRRLQQWPTETRFAVELHAKYLSSRLAAELARIQLAWAAIGIQSLAPDVLRLTRRSPHTEQLLESVDRLYQVCEDQSVVHLDIIFGLPRQTVDDCFETVDLLMESFPAATIFTGMLQIVAGTTFEELRRQPGWVVLPPEGDCEVAATPTIGLAEMTRVRDLSAGLDAYYLLRDQARPGRSRVRAAELEELGRSLRGTPFWAHPVYARRERFTAAQLGALAQRSETVDA